MRLSIMQLFSNLIAIIYKQPASRFPYEILFLIATFMEGDRLWELRSTCKAFHDASIEACFSVVSEWKERGNRKLDYFNGAQQRLARYVRKLEIGSFTYSRKSPNYLDISALEQMEWVREISFRNDTFWHLRPGIAQLAYKTFANNLTSLNLETSGKRLEDFHLDTLTSSGVRLTSIALKLYSVIQNSSVATHDYQYHALANFINGQSLTLISLTIGYKGSTDTWGKLLCHLQEVKLLKFFSLSIPHRHQARVKGIFQFLLNNVSLQTLHFQCCDPDHCDWMAHLGDPGLLPNLEEIVFAPRWWQPDFKAMLPFLKPTLRSLALDVVLSGRERVPPFSILLMRTTHTGENVFRDLTTLKISINILPPAHLKYLDSNVPHLKNLWIEYQFIGDWSYKVGHNSINRVHKLNEHAFVQGLRDKTVLFRQLRTLVLFPRISQTESTSMGLMKSAGLFRITAFQAMLSKEPVLQEKLSEHFPFVSIKVFPAGSTMNLMHF